MNNYIYRLKFIFIIIFWKQYKKNIHDIVKVNIFKISKMSSFGDFLFLCLLSPIAFLASLGILYFFEKQARTHGITSTIPAKSTLKTKAEILKNLENKLENEYKLSMDVCCDKRLRGVQSPNGSKYMRIENIYRDEPQNTKEDEININIKQLKKEIEDFLFEEIENVNLKEFISHIKNFGYELKIENESVYAIKKGFATFKF